MAQYSKSEITDAIARAEADGNPEVVRELKALLSAPAVEPKPAQPTGQTQPVSVMQQPTPVAPRSPVMGSGTGFYAPNPASISSPTLSKDAMGIVSDIAAEGGGSMAGAAIGALPMLSIPTGGLSIPAGSAIGGFIGNSVAQLRRGEKYKVGEALGAAVGSAAVPGAGTAAARSTARGFAREAIKQGASNVGAVTTASIIDRGELPEAGEAAIATAAALAGAKLNVLTTSGKGVSEETKKFLQNAGRDLIYDEGIKAGYIFDAVASNPNATTKMVSKIGGESDIQVKATLKNQEVTNKLVRQELGMPETWSIAENNVKGAIKNASAPYQKLKALGPGATDLVNTLEDTRKLERESWAQWRDKGGAELKERALQAGKEAEDLEDKLDIIAKSSGKPGLVDELRAGRVQLGKLYTLQIAGNLSAGTVDARVLAAINHEMPNKLTGGFKLAAQAAAVQPHMFTPAEKIVPRSTRTGQVTGGIMGFTAGAAIADRLGAGPGMALAGGGIGAGLGVAGMAAAQELLAAPFQKLATSQSYQRSLGMPKYQLDSPEAIPTFLLQAAKAAGR